MNHTVTTISIMIIFIIFLSFAPNVKADSISPAHDPIKIPFSESDLVVVGKVINLTKIISTHQTQYSVAIDLYLKNPKSFGMITVIGDGIKSEQITNYDEVTYYNEPIFKTGDKVFLYLKKEDGNYKVLPYSFGINTAVGGPPPEVVKINSYKNTYYGSDPITISGIIQKGFLYMYPSASVSSIKIYNPKHELYLSDNIPVNPDGSFVYPFKINGNLGITGGYEYDLLVGSSLTGISFDYFASPLKQFKSGISVNEIQCKEGFELILKSKDGSPSCVKPETKQKLIERGWGAEMAVHPYSPYPDHN